MCIRTGKKPNTLICRAGRDSALFAFQLAIARAINEVLWLSLKVQPKCTSEIYRSISASLSFILLIKENCTQPPSDQ